MVKVHCPFCNSLQVIKKGERKGNYYSAQVYRCKSCNAMFADKLFKHFMYPAKVIYDALNYYHIGHTYDETSRYINKQFKIKTGKSTIYSWVKKFEDICPISRFHKHLKNYDSVVFFKQFEHENLDYEFMYHKYKLQLYAKSQFLGLFKYIRGFESGCPDEFFEIGERCSKPKFKVDVTIKKQVNLACHIADFAVQAKRNNRERHSLVERFMLINDTATVACEVPVWYWEKSIDSGVTGHIDLLQIRNKEVVILDYKPNAAKDRKASQQLYHYAVALSFRAGVAFDRIRCAWFDESGYYEYKPSEAQAKLIKWKQ